MKSAVKFSSGRTALLIIDLQEEQRSDPLYATADIEKVLANARRLLLAARKHKIPVFHAAYWRDYVVAPLRPFEPQGEDGHPLFSIKDSPLTAICREVAPENGEAVIYKNDASAFSEGSLKERLAALKIEWLVIAGVWTESCVAASVRDAIAAGFRVLLVKDACGSGSAAIHVTGVLNLANRLYGGGVANVARAEALMAGAEATVWTTNRPVPFSTACRTRASSMKSSDFDKLSPTILCRRLLCSYPKFQSESLHHFQKGGKFRISLPRECFV